MKKSTRNRSSTILHRKLVQYKAKRLSEHADESDWDLGPWEARTAGALELGWYGGEGEGTRHQTGYIEYSGPADHWSYRDLKLDWNILSELARSLGINIDTSHIADIELWGSLSEYVRGTRRLGGADDSMSVTQSDFDADVQADMESATGRTVRVIRWATSLAAEPTASARALRDRPKDLEVVQRQIVLRTTEERKKHTYFNGTSSLDSKHGWNIVVLTAPVWLRPLTAWRGATMTELLDYLLVGYRPPELFWRWLSEDRSKNFVALIWFVCQVQGVSIAKVSRALGWRLTEGAASAVEGVVPAVIDHARSASDLRASLYGFCPVYTAEIMLAATVHWVGANPVDYRRLLKADTYPDHYLPSANDFCASSARWLAKHRDELSDEEAVDILRWAQHANFEARREQGASFSWKGRTPAGALRAALDYRALLDRVRLGEDVTWSSVGLDWETMSGDSSGIGWRIVELLSAHALIGEGAAQRHCVGTYAERCVRGSSSILQVLRSGRREATIEVSPQIHQIVQVRGRHNSRPSEEVVSVVRQWANAMNLGWDS